MAPCRRFRTSLQGGCRLRAGDWMRLILYECAWFGEGLMRSPYYVEARRVEGGGWVLPGSGRPRPATSTLPPPNVARANSSGGFDVTFRPCVCRQLHQRRGGADVTDFPLLSAPAAARSGGAG